MQWREEKAIEVISSWGKAMISCMIEELNQ